ASKGVAGSSTQRATTPTWSRAGLSGTTPYVLTRPWRAFAPTTPQKHAGRSVEPPVWVARAARHIPAATAAPEPPLEPPGVRWRFHGLRVGGGSRYPNSAIRVLPRTTAPAVRRRSTAAASCGATKPARAREPASV